LVLRVQAHISSQWIDLNPSHLTWTLLRMYRWIPSTFLWLGSLLQSRWRSNLLNRVEQSQPNIMRGTKHWIFPHFLLTLTQGCEKKMQNSSRTHKSPFQFKDAKKESKDRACEEKLAHCSRRKDSRTVWEEQANRNITRLAKNHPKAHKNTEIIQTLGRKHGNRRRFHFIPSKIMKLVFWICMDLGNDPKYLSI